MLKVLWDALKFSQVFWSSKDGRFLDQWWPLIWRNCSYICIVLKYQLPVLYSSKMILDYYHETSSKLLMEKIKFESILYLVSHFWIYQMSPSLKCIVPFVAKNQSYRSSRTFSRKLWLSYDNIMMTETSTKRCTAAGLESHFIRRTKYFSNWKFVWHSVSGS